jgi:hypothetical protein
MGKITEIDLISDLEHLRHVDLTVLGSWRPATGG